MDLTFKNKTFNYSGKFLQFIFYPVGVYKIWKLNKFPVLVRVVYTVLGLPFFLLFVSFFSIILFALFLPDLDRSIGERTDRSIVNSTDHYTVTFLKTSKETDGAYEEVEVLLEPQGGNEWHYHMAFVERFHVVEGELTVGMDDNPVKLKAGQDTVAGKGLMHKFYNTSPNPVRFTVRIEPARSFEKTIRSAYGLMNKGKSGRDGIPTNPWHLFLILGYSDSYLQGVPGFIQEPLINALSKIAQWKGEHKELEEFYR
jgi:mannose-6-phosphate isomerase-like protein (cupin superfamily)